MILEMHPERPRPRKIRIVADAMRRGELVAYPTDTTYAVGCDSADKKAVSAIHRFKSEKRQLDSAPGGRRPLSLLFPDLSSIADYAIVDDVAYRLLRRATPGPYTFVLRATRRVPRVMLTRQRTIGIRIPDSPIVLELCRQLGRPIVTTSAARQEDDWIDDPRAIADVYAGVVTTVIDAGRVAADPSTVIDLTEREPTILRLGKGDLDAIGLAG